MADPVQELKKNAEKYAKLYWDTLLKDVIPFWTKNSPDYEHGGYFTCLTTEGKVFDTDKFIWLQAREVWMFSKLYNVITDEQVGKEKREEWLKLAKLGADFLRQHGSDENGAFYFSLERTGKPLIAPYNIFSDCFAAMAFAQYFKASHEEWSRALAVQTYENIEKRKSNPKGKWTKPIGETRSFKALSVPMIDINLSMEMKEAIPELDIEARVMKNIDEVFNDFSDPRGFFRECVSSDPKANDSFEGRVIDPGHSLEALWFIMDVANRRNRKDLVEKCCDRIIKTLEWGWDKEFGGIYYFLDEKGYPPQQLEWDQKLWWVHLETLVGLALGFQLTQRKDFAEWYQKLHDYTWKNFHDPKHGEFFGYLNRRGEVLLQLKGGKWKGFFHVPRALYLCHGIFNDIHNGK